MDIEKINNTTNTKNPNTWAANASQDFSNNMINIDDLLSKSGSDETIYISSNIWNKNSNNEISSWFKKLKMIWAIAWILLLTVVSWVFVYMMYPIEFQNLWKSIQWDSLNWWTSTWIIATNTQDNIDNKNILTEPQLDTWSKNQIDDLFAWKWTWSSISDNSNLETDDPNRLKENIDWSNWLNNDSNILEWLNTWTNYGNGDEDSKIELLWQIRAKTEIAKLNYSEAKKWLNIEAMKIIASSLAKYKKLLTQVENNEIIVKIEVQDKLVEIQADIDKAEMLLQ